MDADVLVITSASPPRSPCGCSPDMRRQSRTYLTITIGLLLIVAAVAVAAMLDPSRFTPDSTTAALQIAIAFVLTFLVVLIVRYVLLLWLGYLQHIENRGRDEESTHQP